MTRAAGGVEPGRESPDRTWNGHVTRRGGSHTLAWVSLLVAFTAEAHSAPIPRQAVARTSEGSAAAGLTLKDFGAVCDGVADDSGAWKSMVSSIGSAPTAVILRCPVHLVGAGLRVPDNLTIVFAGGSIRAEAPIAWAGGIIAPPYPIFTGVPPALWNGNARTAVPIYPQWWGASADPVSTTGSIASGSTALTIANPSGWSVGYGIAVEGAGPQGELLLSRVVGVSGNVLTLAAAAETEVSRAAVHHDDSFALQAAFDAAGRGLELRLNDGLYHACKNLVINGATGLHLKGASAFSAQIRKPKWSQEHDWVLAVNGFSLEIADIGIDGEATPSTSSGWSANVGLYIRGYPQAGVTTGTKTSVFQGIRIRHVGTGLQLGNWDVDRKDPDIETNSFDRVGIDQVNVGVFEDGQNILHNPMRSMWIASVRDYAAWQRRGSDLWFERSYFGPWGDALKGRSKPAHDHAKVRIEAGNLALIGCRSEDQDAASTHPFAYVSAPNASYLLFEGNTITHGARGGRASIASVRLVGVGVGGRQANQAVLIANDTEGYLDLDNIDVVSLGNRYHGVGAGVIDGVRRSNMQMNATNNAKEFLADSQAPVMIGKGRIAQASSSAGPPATGAWARGDYVRNGVVSEVGSAGSKYVIKGWICVAGGTPGTWVQDRAITGN